MRVLFSGHQEVPTPTPPPITRRRDESLSEWMERKARRGELAAESERRQAYLTSARKEMEVSLEPLRGADDPPPVAVQRAPLRGVVPARKRSAGPRPSVRADLVACPGCQAMVSPKKLRKHRAIRCPALHAGDQARAQSRKLAPPPAPSLVGPRPPSRVGSSSPRETTPMASQVPPKPPPAPPGSGKGRVAAPSRSAPPARAVQRQTGSSGSAGPDPWSGSRGRRCTQCDSPSTLGDSVCLMHSR